MFLIQNTQNRESRVINLKLDELLRGLKGARTGFVSLEKMTDEELDLLEQEFERLRVKYASLVDDDLETVQNEPSARQSRKKKPTHL